MKVGWKNFRTYEKILDKISSKIKKFYVIISKVYKKKIEKICWNFESDLGNWKKFVKILNKFPKKSEKIRRNKHFKYDAIS